jgi:hypothetical protein
VEAFESEFLDELGARGLVLDQDDLGAVGLTKPKRRMLWAICRICFLEWVRALRRYGMRASMLFNSIICINPSPRFMCIPACVVPNAMHHEVVHC